MSGRSRRKSHYLNNNPGARYRQLQIRIPTKQSYGCSIDDMNLFQVNSYLGDKVSLSGSFKDAKRKTLFTFLCKHCGPKCFYCGIFLSIHVSTIDKKYPTLDHIVAFSDGGKDILLNIVLSCKRCNELKNDQNYVDFILKQRGFDLEEIEELFEDQDFSSHEEYGLLFQTTLVNGKVCHEVQKQKEVYQELIVDSFVQEAITAASVMLNTYGDANGHIAELSTIIQDNLRVFLLGTKADPVGFIKNLATAIEDPIVKKEFVSNTIDALVKYLGEL